MKVIKWFSRILLAVLAAFAIFLLVMTLTEYKPLPEEHIFTNSKAMLVSQDTLSILSWNIGYAGLDASMDFFYDGGVQTRQTQEKTQENLDAIAAFIHTYRDSIDVFLLQEVDVFSKRTYKLDQLSQIASRLPDHFAFFAHNYMVSYVPVPITDPMGRVESGVATFSRFNPASATRYSYPLQEGWPYRLFSLKRCFLSLRYPLANGKELVVVNTHNSAFDDGDQRKAEQQRLKEFVLGEYEQGNLVVVGGDWNQKPPHFLGNDTGTTQFTPIQIDSTLLPSAWQWVYDASTHSNRYTYEPYVKGQTQTTLIDFFLCSPKLEILSVKTVDLGFANSDHNPVVVKLVLPLKE